MKQIFNRKPKNIERYKVGAATRRGRIAGISNKQKELLLVKMEKIKKKLINDFTLLYFSAASA